MYVAFYCLFSNTHLGHIQASLTLNLVEDYVRFVIAFFEIINTSAPHIYHSALPLSPRTSIIHEMYKKHASPLVRVVQGMLDSWERVVATAHFGGFLFNAVWSPCNRFIAVTKARSVELVDVVTLDLLRVFETGDATHKQQLGFSPDSHFLTLCTGEKFVSWDLRTGGPPGTTPSRLNDRYTAPISFTHSKDGKVVAVAYKSKINYHPLFDGEYDTFIITYDLLSRERLGSCGVTEGRMIYPIWTHDGYLRLATINPESIRIWQSSFTLEHPPVEVMSLPVPDGITDADQFLFLPSLSRLAFALGDTIQVWDLKSLKLLLKSALNPNLYDTPSGSFSSDGRFFAHTNTAGEVCVWKESPAGYLLHQRLPFFTSTSSPGPQLSPNGKSIIVPLIAKIHRWHTRDQDLPLPSVSNKDSGHRAFTVGFSTDKMFAAFGRQKENVVTIIDLKSGESKWITNVGVEIDCLGMARSTVVLVGGEKIVTWNLPGGDSAFNTSINDSVRTTVLHHSSKPHNLGTPIHMLISPDLSHIIVARCLPQLLFGNSLEVYDVSTGLCLARTMTWNATRPLFTQDRREVWFGADSSGEWRQCEIIEDSESGAIELKLQPARTPQSEGFRESYSGYEVTDNGWVLSPSQKRLLWLPHRWRSYGENRAWDGRFLGLLHSELSEVVVLECLE